MRSAFPHFRISASPRKPGLPARARAPIRPPATVDRIHLPIFKLFEDPAYYFSLSTASAQEPCSAPARTAIPRAAGAMFLATQRQSFAKDHTDPLTHHFLTPPASETPEQRAQRESQQASASKRSREIDDWLRAEKAAKEKDRRKRKVQIILVG